jgi:hypothetical protein
MRMKYYISACLIIKNSIDLLEPWLQYHFFIGFEHVYLIDNGSSPKLIECMIVRDYIKQCKITYMYEATPRWQIPGYNYILQTYKSESQWIAFFDCDEYIVLKKNDNIRDFIKKYEDYAGVSIGWYFFGSNNYAKHQPNLFEKYTMRVKHSCHYKTIAQTKYTTRMIIHEIGEHAKNKLVVDETYTPVRGPYALCQHTNDICLNHYVLRSYIDFQCKLKLGAGSDGGRSTNFFVDVNQKSVQKCDAILQYIDRMNFKLNLPSYDHFQHIATMELGISLNEQTQNIVNKLIADPDLIVKIENDINIIPYADIINRFYSDRLIMI